MATVFVSYSHIDSGHADAVTGVLEELGVEYFRDTKNIGWGDSITASVGAGLQKAQGILVIISPASLESHWVPYEIGQARALQKCVLPYLVCPALDVPHYIRDLKGMR